MTPISELKTDVEANQIEFNSYKDKMYINKSGTTKPITFELTSVDDMRVSPFGISTKFNAEAVNSSLELTPTSEIENVPKALFDRLTDEAAKHSHALFGKQMSKTQLDQSFSNPLRKSEKGDLLRLNTLTSIQGFYRVFGSIPVGRLPGTIKGPFKALRYCLKG